MTEQEREAVVDEIVQRELDMFLSAPSNEGPSAAQKSPETFRLMRHMSHSAHEDAFLESYLDDLRQAQANGRNFMVEKYSLLNNLIEPLNDSPLLDEVADAEIAFLEEAAELYPQIIKRDKSDVFRNYIRSELQTLSAQSLRLYADEIRLARGEKRNLALERHNWLAKKLGKPPLV